jgi:hypothetical protein
MIDKINAPEIDIWAKSKPRIAQEVLPELIIRLILATSKKIISFNFPIEKGIQYAGYDGVLESSEESNFIPHEKSVWEFGTDEWLKTIMTMRNRLGLNIQKRRKFLNN